MSVRYRDYLDVGPKEFDAVVVGSGLAGSIVARELAERARARVLVIEKRPRIGGNLADEVNDAGILVHCYGPHVFHTSNERVRDYVKRFSRWRPYEHRVLANWYGTYLPVPFNRTSLEIAFGHDRSRELFSRMVDAFGAGAEVTVSELLAQHDPDLKEVADFVYRNVFSYYSEKQWGIPASQVDDRIIGRVPVRLSNDDRYFTDSFQGIPAHGYTAFFESLLDHENISACLGMEAENAFELVFASRDAHAPLSAIKVKDRVFEGPIVYTGPLDELFLSRFGRLPYRSLDFAFETFERERVLPCGTVNFTVTEDYTRMTEFTWLTGQAAQRTTVVREYPRAYEDAYTQVPCYPIINDANLAHYEEYRSFTATLPNFYPVGRLAEYRYYHMPTVGARLRALADRLCDR